jgi:hypothetical protein
LNLCAPKPCQLAHFVRDLLFLLRLRGEGLGLKLKAPNISANIAVVNFVPIPIVDGGRFTLLILHKTQCKPLSSEMQRIVQIVGLVLLLGVFALATFQGIARMARYAN